MSIVHDIYGHLVRVTTQDSAIAAAVHDALSGFPVAVGPGDRPLLHLNLTGVDSPGAIPFLRSETTRVVGQMPERNGEGGGVLMQDGARWVMDFGQAGLLSLDLNAGQVDAWVVQPGAWPPDFAGSFVLMGLIELLRTRDVYAVHCAALAKDNEGVLFIAPGGSGKTTACITMTRAGYRCLSDDHPLLRMRDGKLEILPFPGRLSVTDRTVAWFPELEAVQAGFRQGTRKRSFTLSDVQGYTAGEACRPAVLIFPRITECDVSVLEPLPKPRALEELLPQALLVLDPALAARQFQTMTALVRETPAYRLYFGEDVLRLPELVSEVLARHSGKR